VISVCIPLAALLCYPEAGEAKPLWEAQGTSEAMQEAALALLAETVSRDARAYVKSQVKVFAVACSSTCSCSQSLKMSCLIC
jgi:hypothetical protein